MDWISAERLPCVVFTLAGAVLLALRLCERAARRAWLALLLASLTYAVVLTALPENLTNINIVHYYLGAKYDVPYSQFYRVTYAALERPQVAVHDLERPPAYLRGTSAEQRAYYIDLLRSNGQAFDPLTATEALRQQAISSGAVAREADSILRAHLDVSTIEPFKDDVRRALVTEGAESNIAHEQRQIGDDYGFNGSPLYATVRQLDPTLHRPLDRWVGIVNLAWQIPSVLVGFWLLGAAIGLGPTQRLAALALLFSSWDLAGWSLPGLILGGVWLPIGLACWLLSRGREKHAGVAIAWAGLLKIFPLVMLLPSAVALARKAVRRSADPKPPEPATSHVTLLASCSAGVVALVLVSLPVGRSWPEYLAKIAVQFGSQAYLLNGVSLDQLLMVLGVFDTPVLTVLRVLLLGILGTLLWSASQPVSRSELVRRAVVVLALCGWLVDTWFNYYALAPLVLLVCASQARPLAAAAGVAAMTLATYLPEFDSPVLLDHPAIWALKLAPYLAIPCWLAWVEFAPHRVVPAVKRTLVVLVTLVLALTAGEIYRQALMRNYAEQGNRALDQGDAQSALELFEKQLMFSSRNAEAEMNRGVSFAMLGRVQDAAASFSRTLSLNPSDVRARVNYAHLLLKLAHYDEAMAQVEAALDYAPCSVDALIERGRIQLAQKRDDDARASLWRALELDPANRTVALLLASQ